MKILFIEDEDEDFEFYRALLPEHEIIRHERRTGATTLARREEPDFVIMDVQLDPSKPIKEGETLAHEWRRSPARSFLRKVPIMILTHFETVEMAEKRTHECWEKERIWFCSKDAYDMRLSAESDRGPKERFLSCFENILAYIEK